MGGLYYFCRKNEEGERHAGRERDKERKREIEREREKKKERGREREREREREHITENLGVSKSRVIQTEKGRV